ncbi:MAG: 3-oxoacyl-ACP reductase family protein [Candidatus Methylomirabilota bacterium]|jgi:NAD(P)-dependent dehydrogenase (short-subunit alcohol dehydrogenase family)
MPGLTGKVAMVTGCSGERGIGRAVARRLAAGGADLIVTSSGTRVATVKPSSGWAGLDSVAKEVQEAGQRALTAHLDVRSASQIEAVVDQALQTFGRLDILVNNAAAPPGADRVPVVQLSEEAWDTVLDVNLKGTFLCAKAAANAMLRQKIRGRIINIGSDNCKIGQPKLAAYCASKFGLVGFTQALAMELALAGITVNTVCPGPVDTERVDYFGRREDGSYDHAQRIERLRRLAAEIPLGRLATPEDVAELTAFLASDAAEYITGQAINLVGGLIMH